MDVVRSPAGREEPSRRPPRPCLTLYTASAFLRDQADCLRRGLDHADDPEVVAQVLRAHEAAHAQWLSMFAAAEPLGAPASDALASLYGFHGRIAGALELRGSKSTVGDRHVRELLKVRLRARTDQALRSLRAAGLGTRAGTRA